MKRTLVINAVGLTPELMSQSMPRLVEWSKSRHEVHVVPDLPAVTCTAQASMLTGLKPGGINGGHGAVANGWFFRDLSEVWLWRQSVELITPSLQRTNEQASSAQNFDTIFDRWRATHPGSTTAQIFWWWNLPSRADLSITPRPTYWADGSKGPDIHSNPPSLRQRLQDELGPFPLFQFWGPGAGIASTRWIIDATLNVLQKDQPGLTLCYLPHLDYDLQRFGPHSPEAGTAAKELDAELFRLLEFADQNHLETVVLSEYGLEEVDQAVEPNRALRSAGLLQVHPAKNGALLDPGNSDAFALCDHQAAHVYVKDPSRIEEVASLLENLQGVETVYRTNQFAEIGLDHPRSGELFCLAERGTWFAYPYWIDGDVEPDFARTVDIHRKPGFDPCELFLDPRKPWIKARMAAKLLAKKLGMRVTMDLIPVDTSLVKGSHGRLPTTPQQGPLWIGPKQWLPLDRDWISPQEALSGICNRPS